MRLVLTRLGLSLGLIMLAAAPAIRASVIIASDNASNYTTWGPGSNGGTGWGGPWAVMNQTNVALTATNGGRGWFLGDSRGNDSGGVTGDSNGDFDINNPASAVGKAFGVYSNTSLVGGPPGVANTDNVYAIRPLASALQVGQTISWDMDNGNVDNTQVVGMRFLSNAADDTTRVFEFRFVGGATDYTVFGSTTTTTTVPFTREGLHVDYTLTGASTFSVKVTNLVNGNVYTTTGTNVNANSINAIAFKNQLAGNGSTNDGYFNNITVSAVPEPASMGLIFGAIGLLARRRNAAN